MVSGEYPPPDRPVVEFDVVTVDWTTIGSAALGAAILSLLTSIGSDALTGTGPSLTSTEVLEE